jgi:hypothetical protein
MGPDARAAVPALKRARRDEAIGPEATEALRKIKYYTSWVREVEKSFEQAMPAVLLIVVTLVLGLLMYQLFRQAKPAVYNLALSFWVIGGVLGYILGGSRWGRWGAVLSAFVLGLGGAMMGAAIGYIAGIFFDPLI